MNKIISIFLIVGATIFHSYGQQFISSNHITGSGTADVDAFIVDEIQNTYISGYFSGQLIHNNISVTTTGSSDYDIFLTKYNDDQKEEWFVTIGGSGADRTTKVAFSNDGNILISGSYASGCILGTTTGNSISLEMPDGSSGSNMFLAKYNSNTGQLMWGKVIVAGTGNQIISSLAIDNSGNILVGGRSTGNAAFLPNTENALSSRTGFIAKFNPNGEFLWNISFLSATSGTSVATGIATTANQYLFSGYTTNAMTLTDRSGNTQTIGPNGTVSYFYVGSLSTDGNLQWIKNSTGTGTSTISAISLDDDNLFVTGTITTSDCAYDGNPLNLQVVGTGGNAATVFLLNLNANNGEIIEAHSKGSTSLDVAYGLQAKNDILYLVGRSALKMFVQAYTINDDKTLSFIDVLDEANADNTRGVTHSPKGFKLTGTFTSASLVIGDSTFYNPNTATNDIYMAKACPIIAINDTAYRHISGCDIKAANGAIKLDIAGGAEPYTYHWEKLGEGLMDEDGSMIVDLDTGRYTVTVIYNSGRCSKSRNFTIEAPEAVYIKSLDVTDALCEDGDQATGNITIEAHKPAGGGELEYMAEWYNPSTQTGGTIDWQSSPTLTDCPPGQYTVYVRYTDETCMASATTSLTLIDGDYTLDVSVEEDYECSIGNGSELVGKIKVATSDDRELDWFALVDGVSGATVVSTSDENHTPLKVSEYTFEEVAPGNYKARGGMFGACSQLSAASVTLTTVPTIAISSAKPVDVLCYGESTGSITAAASGGTGTLLYELFKKIDDEQETGPIDDETATPGLFKNLTSGTYRLVVTDENSCQAQRNNIIINENPKLEFESVTTSDACYAGSNGSVTLKATGGAASGAVYTYALTGGNIIEENDQNKKVSSGAVTYEGLSVATNYAATVMEQDTKCTATYSGTIEIGELDPITATITHTDVLCKGASTGAVTVTGITGGTGSYEVTVNSVKKSGDTSSELIFTELPAGTYTVDITDGNGCTPQTAYSVTITEPETALSITSITANATGCAGWSDGSVTVAATGGTTELGKPLMFELYKGVELVREAQESSTFNGLPAGNYVVQVIDANGCTALSGTAEVTQPAGVTYIVNIVDVSCYGGNDGSISLSNVSSPGQTKKYYLTNENGGVISEEKENPVFSGLSAGVYKIQIIITGQCDQLTEAIEITEPEALAIVSATPTIATCNNDGTITVEISGGVAPYTVKANELTPASISGSTYTFTGLAADSYTISVSDNCVATPLTETVVVEQTESPVIASASATKMETCLGNDGEITVTASGITDLQYSIDGVTYQTSPIFTGLAAGDYTVTVKDENACTASETVTVTHAPDPAKPTVVQSKLATCDPSDNGEITVTMPDGDTYEFSIDGGNTYQSGNVFTGLTTGTAYTVTVKNEYSCTTDGDPVTIERTPDPAKPVATQSKLATCVPDHDGEITVTMPDGDTYEFSIDGGSTYQPGNIISGLTTGTAYTVTVKDGNGCTTDGDPVTIERTPDPLLTATITKYVRCDTETDGEVTLSAEAQENGSNSFQFSFNGSTPDPETVYDELRVGTYTATVTDGNGCVATNNAVTVRMAVNPVVTSTVTPSCYHENNGTLTAASVSDGTPTKYRLSGSFSAEQSTPEFTGLRPGDDYMVTVTDTYGCVGESAVTAIEESGEIKASIAVTDASSASSKDGSITVSNVQGGTPNYTVSCDGVNKIVEAGGSAVFDKLYPNKPGDAYSIGIIDAAKCAYSTAREVGIATGVEDMDAMSLKIYPNPSDGRFIIEWISKKDIKANIEIYNTSGRLIYKTQVQTGVGGVRTTIDISNYARGSYILRVPELEINEKLIVH